MRRFGAVLLGCVLIIAASGCRRDEDVLPTLAVFPTITPSATHTPTDTPTATFTPSDVPTDIPTPTLPPTITPTPTITDTPIGAPTATPSGSITPTSEAALEELRRSLTEYAGSPTVDVEALE